MQTKIKILHIHFFSSGKYTKDNHLSTLNIVNCHLPVVLFPMKEEDRGLLLTRKLLNQGFLMVKVN
jgi:hypothetical protein